ncbi:MAG TPA: dihydrofolate reductase family protein, partial [Ignavibacteria bacterium]|nr:dihydrofolate reductase family protein [Ignavibacteria bacterium]
NYIKEITEPVDCIVLGRKLAQGFIPYWTSNPELEGAEKINSSTKVVFTKTLEKSEWKNTVLAKGELADEIGELKKKEGKDIIAYGGADFVSSLIRQDLIDEYHLLINPSAIGSGMPIFSELENIRKLKLVRSKAFDCGIIILNYEPVRIETISPVK